MSEANNYPIVSSYEYRGVTIKVKWQAPLEPQYQAFRLNQNGYNQILTDTGFSEVPGYADPDLKARIKYNVSLPIKFDSLDHVVDAIDKVIKDEKWSALSDRTAEIYKEKLNYCKAGANRDEIWAAACLETGFKNTRANAS